MTATETALDRYITFMGRAAHDTALLDDLSSIFAVDATVAMGTPEVVAGLDAITEFYRGFYAGAGDSKHFWTTTVLDDGTLKAHFIVAGRNPDGSLMARSGIEHATVNDDGLITSLTVTFTGALDN
ncbi:nuclear transport factor 2 family protein [Paractinoplanes atraurantiacus]|uniref:SnoaL-like domain-containing protein n=1 Tax=Paractinoplanes atraurantiacus TaxID=1036182 RepID=A0A285H6G7_9ACTN|nr:nuclear transport factor 2 family protein [Actinoplanes atraurantiacus]SNY31357.1 SnoaL-like domain-containing protein [Actinoplanes atraurantiacus]